MIAPTDWTAVGAKSVAAKTLGWPTWFGSDPLYTCYDQCLLCFWKLCGKRDAERRAFLRLVLQLLLGRPAKGKKTAAPIFPTRRRSNWLTEVAVLARGTLLPYRGTVDASRWIRLKFGSLQVWHKSEDETDGRRTNVVEEINPADPVDRICVGLGWAEVTAMATTMKTIVHAVYLLRS